MSFTVFTDGCSNLPGRLLQELVFPVLMTAISMLSIPMPITKSSGPVLL